MQLTATATSLRVAPCIVSGQLFCFDAQNVLGMLESNDCTFADDSIDGLVGQADFLNKQIPVYDLRELLDLPQQSVGDNQRIVVTKTPKGDVGFLVDDALRTRDPRRLFPLPSNARDPRYPFVNGVTVWDGDDSLTNVREEVALRLCAESLIGVSPSEPPKFTEGLSSTSDYSHVTGERKRQLMLFEVPHQDWEDRVVSIALSVTQVLEITAPQALIEVPRVPNGVMGLIPWRDQFVPVLDLTHKLSLGSIPEDSRRRIVVARDEDNLVAFYTSSGIRTLAKPFSQAKTVDMGLITKSSWTKGTFCIDEDVLVLPNFGVSS